MGLNLTGGTALCPGSTQEDPSRYDGKLVDWDIKNQHKKNPDWS